MPWVVDEEACDVLRKFTRLKNRLEPYLTSQSIQGVVEQGHPVMRPMLLEYPNDKTSWFLDQQYMLGTDLLVAPVFGESEVDFYVPAGVFTNILTGLEVTGPAWVSERHSMSTLPVLLRPDAVMVVGKPGHTVVDNINERGYSVIVSRQISRAIRLTVSMRKGKTFDLDVEPVFENDSLVGLDISQTGGTSSFDVIVIGNGMGLDDESGLPKYSADKGACQVRW